MESKISESDMLEFLEKLLWDPNGEPVYHASLKGKKLKTALHLWEMGCIKRHELNKKVVYAITSNGMNLFVNVKMLKYTKSLEDYTKILIIIGLITILATLWNTYLFYFRIK